MTDPRRSWRDGAALLALGALLFLPGIGARDLWNPDEPRYAEVSREMLAAGDVKHFFVPHLNGEIYTEKPPLLFWLICLTAQLGGRLDETTARLPLVLSAIAALALLLRIGELLFDRLAAWFAVAVFGTCINLMLQARSAQIDMLLVCLVSLALYCWLRGHLERRPGWTRGFYLAAGLATLAKGPAGLLPPLLTLLLFLVVSGQRDRLRDLRVLSGLGLWAVVVLVWLLPGALLGGEAYWRPLVLRQNFQRFADPWGHVQPWYYYLSVLPAVFFPWFFLLPGAIAIGAKRFAGRERAGWLFAVCWMTVTLVFFSLSPGKRTVYILTMYPAMALLIGAAMARLAREARSSRAWLAVPAALLVLVTGSATVAALLVPRFPGRVTELAALDPVVPRLAAAILGLLTAGAAVAFVLALRRRARAAFSALAASSGLAGILICVALLPWFEPIKSARSLAERFRAQATDTERLGMFPRLDPQFLFYTGRLVTVIRDEAALRAFVAGPGTVWVIAEREPFERIAATLPLVEIARDDDPRSGYALLRSKSLAARDD